MEGELGRELRYLGFSLFLLLLVGGFELVFFSVIFIVNENVDKVIFVVLMLTFYGK